MTGNLLRNDNCDKVAQPRDSMILVESGDKLSFGLVAS